MTTLGKIRELGLVKTTLCAAEIAQSRVLQAVYGFDHWHASQGFHCRCYKQMVVDLADQLRPTTAVEIGCGLGDILCRIQAERRYGLDLDEGVVMAARRRHRDKSQFVVGSFADVAQTREPVIDVVVMVNVLHSLDAGQVRDGVEQLRRAVEVKHLIVDEIVERENKSLHCHKFAEILGDGWSRIERVSDGSSRWLETYRAEPA
ncbi:MAG: methyltransferase [Pirellulaceae bacterium]|jgi:ubiquinone/menaquinone biosynthesis C-methylase UbiE|nr:methyltransferase [Pirellulaceae bacterium]MDP7019374.1 methyltransferase [Pirellulaceae bacterium]